MFRLLHRLRFLFAFLAGTLLAASFPTIDLPWLAWLSPGLILWVTQGTSGKKVFRAGYVAGLGRYLVSLYWLLLIPFPLHSIAGFVALAAVLAIFTAAWCWFCWRIFPGRKPSLKSEQKATGVVEQWPSLTPLQRLIWPLLCAAAWVAMEMTIARVLTGFPWDFLGASQFRLLPLIQIASITGIYGVSFLVTWVSVSLLGAIILIRRSERKTLSPALLQILLPLLTIICVLFFGENKLSAPENDPKHSSAKLKIALVQPAIPQPAIWDSNEKTNRFLKLLKLSRTALTSQPDLLVWPEAAMPDMFTRNRYTQEAIISLLRSNHAWMVMGASDSQPKKGATNSQDQERFNSAFLINPMGDLITRYHKQHLVMFGEYMPFARQFPFLTKLRAAGAGLVPGERDVPFQIEKPHAKFSVLICFEDVFPHEARQRVDEETDFLLNLTNDGWFGEGAAQWQHAISALFRAVENGVPLVRCTNNGLTCWIDSCGRLHEIYFDGSKNIYRAGYKIVEVPLRPENPTQASTFYNRHGDWFGWGCMGVVAFAWLRCFFQNKAKRK